MATWATNKAASALSLAAVGSTPSANGASVSGLTLTLQPADGTNPGLVTAGTQTIGGAKTLTGALTLSNTLLIQNTNAVTHHKFNTSGASSLVLRLEDSSSVALARWDTAGNMEMSVAAGKIFLGSGTLDNGGPRLSWVSGILKLEGAVVASGVACSSDNQATTLTTGAIHAFLNNGTEKMRVRGSGGLVFPSGAAAVAGTATLSAGTVTVSTTAIATASSVLLTLNTPGGTLGSMYSAPAASISNGVSFVINSVSTLGAVVNTDTSTVNWWILN